VIVLQENILLIQVQFNAKNVLLDLFHQFVPLIVNCVCLVSLNHCLHNPFASTASLANIRQPKVQFNVQNVHSTLNQHPPQQQQTAQRALLEKYSDQTTVSFVSCVIH
jgi:hypothetical protein